MSGEKEREREENWTGCHEKLCLERGEKASEELSWGSSLHCTALGTFYQWMQCYFSAGDNIIISLGMPGPATLLFILFLEIGCEKPEILYVGC